MKGNYGLHKDREQKGVVISKKLLGKAKGKQKGHSWTMKTTKALD